MELWEVRGRVTVGPGDAPETVYRFRKYIASGWSEAIAKAPRVLSDDLEGQPVDLQEITEIRRIEREVVT